MGNRKLSEQRTALFEAEIRLSVEVNMMNGMLRGDGLVVSAHGHSQQLLR
jgi:hypothetical protein